VKKPKAIAFAIATAFAALWACPLARAISFYRSAQAYFGETASLDASEDLRFSTWLLASYAVSLLAAFAFAWLISRRPSLFLLLPGGLLAFAAGQMLLLHPEAPILFFRTMPPLAPALISAVAVAVAALFVYFPRRRRHG
jgi:hypothetical protein